MLGGKLVAWAQTQRGEAHLGAERGQALAEENGAAESLVGMLAVFVRL